MSIRISADLKLKKLIIIGDKVLIRPIVPNPKTQSGLYLPPGVQEKEQVQSGYVIKTGPGHPLPLAPDVEEPWKPAEERSRYLPLQVHEGDRAIFLQKSAYEIHYEGEKLYIVPQAAILMVEREDDLI